ncbi:MAG: phospholipase D family protein, partial [Candidatus Hermodarchaeota archaeon]
MAKNSGRKNVEKKRKKDENIPLKFKSLEDAYEKKRVRDEIAIKRSIIIENDQLIKYSFIKNEDSPEFDKKQFNWFQLSSTKVNANIGQKTIHKKCINLIKKAKEFICISSFLFENNTELCKELYNMSNKGIRIYLLLASQVLLDKIQDDIEDHENIKSHIQFLNEAGQGYMFIRSGEVHSKFILIDPKSEDSKGILLTANITKRALEINNEIGIELDPNQVKELYKQ